MMRTADQVTAQVATEAIINDPDDYELDTMVSVLAHARAVGVAQLYVDQLHDVVDAAQAARGSSW